MEKGKLHGNYERSKSETFLFSDSMLSLCAKFKVYIRCNKAFFSKVLTQAFCHVLTPKQVMMKPKFLLLLPLCIASTSSFAAYCYNAKGVTENVNYDLSTTFSSANNQLGKIVEISKNFSQQIMAVCDKPLPGEPKDNFTTRIYQPEVNVVEVVANYKYMPINDYLTGAMRIQDSFAGIFFPPGIFQMGSHGNVSQGLPFPVNDSNLIFRIKVVKPFVGSISIPSKTLFSVKAITNDYPLGGTPIYTISYTGRIIAPQSCTIDSGKTIEFNFGDITASAFSQAGVGGKPNTVTPQTKNISIQCSNINATAILSLRIEAEKAEKDMLVSSNPDIGFKIANMSDRVLIPNDVNSVTSFMLNQSQANITLKAWPVSITGKKPATGPFNSRAYIRIDFP
ncbi:MAG: putative fimbrial-like protein SfmH [Acinetobacter bereziniae]|uniref:Putative fimbrial-like protein SfmH n=1 Tax=Acinetobacter bereziniae TaxID=106648 RepID=A0A833PJD7_ACIBZ|nr:MAG: putative fimbrial-like protein SfmH [Acinetobacter bereziniae]